MFYGLLNLSLVGYIVTTLILTHITIVSVTIYLHRCQAHRSLDLHPALSHFFRFWLWLTTGMVTKSWASIHRKHHAKCESTDDPHSPQILGLNKVLWEGAELYRAEAKNKETLERYGHGTPDDWIERHLYTPHSAKGIALMFVLDLLLFGVPGITVWAVQMFWIPFFAAGVINGVGHFWGYRNFECPDAATNIVPWGILIGGEELHNNHHTFPTSAKFSVKWWEFDLGWCYIWIFSKLGLVKVKRVPPKLAVAANKSTLDVETLKAILINRFQIMARYSEEVILPVVHQEKAAASEQTKKLIAKAKSLLIREQSLVKPDKQQQLEQILQERENLKLVYQFRLKLQALWSKTSATQKELLEALQEWCNQAQQSKIEVLKRFASHLPNFSIPQ